MVLNFTPLDIKMPFIDTSNSNKGLTLKFSKNNISTGFYHRLSDNLMPVIGKNTFSFPIILDMGL